jgi:transposase-like protein
MTPAPHRKVLGLETVSRVSAAALMCQRQHAHEEVLQMTHTIDELAGIFGVTAPTVQKWIFLGLPVTARGRRGRGGKKTQVGLKAAVSWYFARNFERLKLLREQTRLLSEQADKVAADNAERARDLAPLSLIQREFGALLAAIRTNAGALAGKLAPELEGLTIEERKATIDRAVFDFLDRLAAWEPSI